MDYVLKPLLHYMIFKMIKTSVTPFPLIDQLYKLSLASSLKLFSLSISNMNLDQQIASNIFGLKNGKVERNTKPS